MDSKVSFALLLAVFSCISAEDVTFMNCPEVPESSCKVNAVRITPCKGAPKECRLQKGNVAAISFEFTPQFSATNSTQALYWANGGIEPEFSDLDKEACKYTTCPLETGKPAVLNYQLKLKKKLPNGIFPIKWKVCDEAVENFADCKNVCCFITTIVLRK